MPSLCDICKKTYASTSSLWNHKNKIHGIKKTDVVANVVIPVVENVVIKSVKDNKTCKYCNIAFADRISRWKHEKKYCKAKDISGSEFTELYNTVKELKKEIEVLKQNQKAPENQIMSNSGQTNINCGTVNNIINIIPIGKENLDDLLTEEQIAEILKLSVSESINKSLLLVYTADNLRSCRNTYISSLEGKNCKIYDEEQKKFITKQKDKVLDDVLLTHTSNVRTIVDTHGKPKKQERARDYFNKLDTDETLQKQKKIEFNAIINDNKDKMKPFVNSINKDILPRFARQL